ncbi:MAG: type II secretion system protein GspC [Beggiatoa sp. IS2]|nr:MAG: type II secretion system protein GspC [Beggiatoa sp. IS2]
MRYFLFSTRWMMNSILSAILGYKLVWLVLSFNQVPITQMVTTTQAGPTADQMIPKTATYNLNTLLSAQLFGNPEEKIRSPQASTSPPPKTKLNLKLYGIYYSTHPEASIAMIAEEIGESKLYRKYDTLPGGGTLYQINSKEVILLRNGRQETLLLINNQSPPTTQNPETPAVRETPSITEQSTLRQAQSTAQSPEQLLGEYQQQLRTNPQQLRNLLNVTPYSQDGQFIGYRLSAGQNATLMSTFNLQVGDILTEINGVVFDSPLKGLEVIQQLATAGQINATVLRNGQPLSLSFNVEK